MFRKMRLFAKVLSVVLAASIVAGEAGTAVYAAENAQVQEVAAENADSASEISVSDELLSLLTETGDIVPAEAECDESESAAEIEEDAVIGETLTEALVGEALPGDETSSTVSSESMDTNVKSTVSATEDPEYAEQDSEESELLFTDESSAIDDTESEETEDDAVLDIQISAEFGTIGDSGCPYTIDSEGNCIVGRDGETYTLPDYGYWRPANEMYPWNNNMVTNVSFKGDVIAISCSHMFNNSNLECIDIKNLNTNNVTDMSYMFSGCSGLTSLDLNDFDTSNTTSLRGMFRGCIGLTSLDISNLNTINVTDMKELFYGCTRLINLDICNLDTRNVTDMGYMFADCKGLTSLDVSGLNTSSVINMGGMFRGSNRLLNINLCNLDTSSVAAMGSMFSGCSRLTSVDLSGLDTKRVTTMIYMFHNCSSLKSVGLEGIDTGRVSTMGGMFSGCCELTRLDISSFDTSNITVTKGMFDGCNKLNQLFLSDNFYFIDDPNLRVTTWTNGKNTLTTSQLIDLYDGSAKGDIWRTSTAAKIKIVTLNAINGTVSGKEKRKIIVNDNGLLSDLPNAIPKDSSLVFDGWYTDERMGEKVSKETQFTKDTELFARYYSVNEIRYRDDMAGYINNVKYTFGDSDLEKFYKNLSQWTLKDIKNAVTYDKMHDYLNGICYGTSCAVIANKTGVFDLNECGVNSFNELKAKDTLHSTVGSYNAGFNDHLYILQLSQMTNAYKNELLAFNHLSLAEKLQSVIDAADDVTRNGPALLVIKTSTNTSHAMVVDGIEKGTYCINGKDYTYKVTTWDPNSNEGVAVKKVVRNPDGSDMYISGNLDYYTFTRDDYYSSRLQNNRKNILLVTAEDRIISAYKYPEPDRIYNSIKIYSGAGSASFDENSQSFIYAAAGLGAVTTNKNSELIPLGTHATVEKQSGANVLQTEYTTPSLNMYVSTDAGQIETIDNNMTLTKGINKYRFDIFTISGLDNLVIEGNTDNSDKLSVSVNGNEVFISGSGNQNMSISCGNDKTYITSDKAIKISYSDDINKLLLSTDEDADGTYECEIFAVNVSYQKIWTYTGREIEPKVTVFYGDRSLTEGTDYTIEYADNTDVGDGTITIEGKSEYRGKNTFMFSVVPNSVYAEDIPQQKFIGKALTPIVRLHDADRVLQAGVDYTVKYKNNKNAYELYEDDEDFDASKAPQAIITMKGNYKGTKTLYFRILQREFYEENVSKEALTVTYTGKKQTPYPVVKVDGNTLKYGKDFIIPQYEEAKADKTAFTASNEYPITIIGIGNYMGSVDAVLKISDSIKQIAMSKISVSGISKSYPWNGEQIRPATYVLKNGKYIMIEGTDYTVEEITEGSNKVAGTGSITFVGTGEDSDGDGVSFIGTKNITFTIAGTPMSKIKVEGFEAKKEYTGSEIIQDKASLSVALPDKSTKTLIEGSDYTAQYSSNINKGTAYVTYTGNPDNGFTGSIKKTFSIVNANVGDIKNKDGSVTPGKMAIAYKNESGKFSYVKGGVKPEVIVTIMNNDGTVLSSETGELKEGHDYTLKYSNNKAVTTSATAASKLPKVTATGKGNYSGSVSRIFTIIPKALSNENGCYLVINDKVSQTKKGGYIQSVAVYDSDRTKLSSSDYDTKTIKYELIQSDADSSITESAPKALDKTSIVSDNGIIRVTVTGKGNYAGGTVIGTYRILGVGMDISKATIKIRPLEYTGKEVKITDMSQFAVVKDKKGNETIQLYIGKDKTPLTLEKDIEVVEDSYVKNINKGTAKVTFHGIGSYGGYKTVSYSIGQKSIADHWAGIIQRLTELLPSISIGTYCRAAGCLQ